MKKILDKIKKRPGLIVVSAIVIYLAVFSFICLWKYQNFQYNGLDLAIINQVYYNSIHGQWFASSIHPPSYLGDHFSPIMLLLLPVYWLWQSPQTLLLLQTLALGLSAWLLYLIAKKAISPTWGCLIAVAWLVNPFVQNINLFEFHDLSLAIPLILSAFYFYQHEKFFWFVSFCGLALLAREDVALVIAAFGVLALIEKKPWRWWLIPLVLSASYFCLAIQITSWAAPDQHYKFLLYYRWLGNSWPEIAKNLLLHPCWLLGRLISPGSLFVGLGLLLSVGGVPLFKPKYLLLSSLVYLQLVLGSNWNWLGMILFTQYSSLLLPGLFLAAMAGLKKVKSFTFADHPTTLRGDKALWTIFIGGTVVCSSLGLGPLPGTAWKIFNSGLVSREAKVKQQLLAHIPPQATVATSFELLTPLSSRAQLASLNYVFLGAQQFLSSAYALPSSTEYLLVDFSDLLSYQLMYDKNSIYQNRYESGRLAWPKLFDGFGLLEIKNSLALFKKGAANSADLVVGLDTLPVITTARQQTADPDLTFLGYNQQLDHFEFFWQNSSLKPKNYYLKLTVEGGGRLTYQKIYPLGYGWLTATAEQGKKVSQTNYWFDLVDQLPGGSYDLRLDLIEVNKGGTHIDADRSTKDVIDSATVLISGLVTEKISW